MNKPHNALVIIGTTASGKTALSEVLAERLDGEIINTDVGQFYKPLKIGTAKPDFESYPWASHLFDVISEPVDLDVADYRERVDRTLHDIEGRRKIPIIVGGSLFYLKSLFFLPFDFSSCTTLQKSPSLLESIPGVSRWEKLNHIDPERASSIHANDTYRVNRALDIWLTTGMKPSLCKPFFSPIIRPLFIVLNYSSPYINKRIDQRTREMLASGWIEETEKLYKMGWADFLQKKQLIGYPEILSWIQGGKNQDLYEGLVNTIQIQTRQYAKRQRTFWRSFLKQLECYQGITDHLISLEAQPDDMILKNVIYTCRNFLTEK